MQQKGARKWDIMRSTHCVWLHKSFKSFQVTQVFLRFQSQETTSWQCCSPIPSPEQLIDWTSHVAVQNMAVWNGLTAWPQVLLLLAALWEPLTQPTSHSTLHILGSSALRNPVQCPFRVPCLERADCLQLSRIAHVYNFDTAIPCVFSNKLWKVNRMNSCQEIELDILHTERLHYS